MVASITTAFFMDNRSLPTFHTGYPICSLPQTIRTPLWRMIWKSFYTPSSFPFTKTHFFVTITGYFLEYRRQYCSDTSQFLEHKYLLDHFWTLGESLVIFEHRTRIHYRNSSLQFSTHHIARERLGTRYFSRIVIHLRGHMNSTSFTLPTS